MSWQRWVKPEVYPLMVPIAGVFGLVAMQLIRNISTNPDVRFGFRVTKENRTAGILENHKEGEKYHEHGLRKFLRGHTPQIMPSINDYFSREKQS